MATRGLLAVNASTLPRMAFPCCARGAECCPIDAANRTPACCSHARVHGWLRRVVRHGGADLQWYTRLTWYDQHFHVFRRGRELANLQQEMWARDPGGSNPPGFSYNTDPWPNRVRPTFSPTMTEAARLRARVALREWKSQRDQDALERRREREWEEAMLRRSQAER